MRNRNCVWARVPITPEVLADSEDDPRALTSYVMAALNETARKRHRRVFEAAELVGREDEGGLIWLTYVASTEPAT